MKSADAKGRGRPPILPAELDRRRIEYAKLKAHLGLSAPAIARLLGMHPTYVHTFPKRAPRQQILDLMRTEAIRRAQTEVDEAKARLRLVQTDG